MVYHRTRHDIAAFMRRLYRQGLTTTSGGNISVRVDERYVLMTPSGGDKARLTARDIVAVPLDNRVPAGAGSDNDNRPSIEARMHIAIYQRLPEVRAVVHAHPPVASAFSATAHPIDCRLISEAYAIIREVGRVPYALMGSDDLARQTAEAAARHVCLLLDNHGALAVGASLLEAFDRLEVLEAAARITLAVTLLGGRRALSRDALRDLDVLMGRAPAVDA